MRYRPEITVAIRGRIHRCVVRALVDTGADYTIFPTEIAADSGIQTLLLARARQFRHLEAR
ncbi:MAG: hypothetical protein AB7I48_19075 [Planctomycetaceae bacterium]